MSLEQNSQNRGLRSQQIRRFTMTAAVTCSLAVLTSGCLNVKVTTDSGSSTIPSATTTPTTTTTPGFTTTTVEQPSATETAAEPTTTELATGTQGDGAATIAGAKLWKSDDGSVTLEVSPDWTESSYPGALGVFSVGEPHQGFQPNVTIVTEKTDLSVQDYLTASLRNVGSTGTLTALDSGVKPGSNGADLGWAEYQGHLNSNPDVELHFLTFFTNANGQMASATFTALVDNYPSLAGGVQPYLETVQAH